MGIRTKQNLTTTNENSTNSENFLAEMQQVENEYVSKETAIKNNGISVANVVEKKNDWNTGLIGSKLFNEDILAIKAIIKNKNTSFTSLLEQWIRRTAKVELLDSQYKSIYGVEKDDDNLRLGHVKMNRKVK